MTAVPVQDAPQQDPFLDAITGGWRWDDGAAPGTEITYFFAPEGFDLTPDTVLGFHPAWGTALSWEDTADNPWRDAAALYRMALQSWANVANITFTEVFSADQANLAEAIFDRADYNQAMQATPEPDEFHNGTAWGAYDFLARELSNPAYMSVGGAGFQTFVHEIGHGLGLQHPHDEGGGSLIWPGVTGIFSTGDNDLNQVVFTVMSYNDGYDDPAAGKGIYPTSSDNALSDYGHAAGPGAFDIATIQALYGANTTYHSGDDFYFIGDAYGKPEATLAIWDTGGTDTIQYIGIYDAIIDLRSATLQNEPGGGGFVSYVWGAPETERDHWSAYTIAADITNVLADVNGDTGVIIENASGGSGADLITGNAADNVLSGNGGADVLRGGAGNDTLWGGDEQDHLFGGLGNDVLHGEAGDDLFDLDAIADGPFDGDVVHGGEGNDAIVLLQETAGVLSFDLRQSEITSIERLFFQARANSQKTVLLSAAQFGGTGISDSLLITSNVGNAPGDSIDQLSIEMGSASTFDMSAWSFQGAISRAIFVTGDEDAEQIVGSSQNDTLAGHGGNDFLYGNAGNDTLDGGMGLDAMFGGSGDDHYEVDDAGDTIAELEGEGHDSVSSSLSYTLGATLEDLLLVGSDHINGTGNALANVLSGNEKNNILKGAAGNDTLTGGAGDDDLDGGAGVDALSGGTGNDRFIFNIAAGSFAGELADGGAGIDTIVVEGSGAGFAEFDLRGANFVSIEAIEFASDWADSDKVIILDSSQFDPLGNGIAFDIGVFGNDQTGSDDRLSISMSVGNNTLHMTDWTFTDWGGQNDVILVTGNSENNTVYGSSQNDFISGLGGNDTLVGNGGNDTFAGGPGNDVMIGGVGDDTYFVDSPNDVAHENFNEGTDEVRSTVGYALRIDSHVENLTLIGADHINGSGNQLANTIIGNSGDNQILGFAGDDSLFGSRGQDVVHGEAGNDTIVWTVGDGRDVIDGGLDTDRFIIEGSSDSETYFVETVADYILRVADSEPLAVATEVVVSRAVGAGASTVIAELSSIEGIDVVGGAGNDILSGGAGSDTLAGGAGTNELDGGDKHDTAVFSGTRANYEVSATADGFLLTDRRTGLPGGVHTVKNVESFQFDNITLLAASLLNSAPTGLSLSPAYVSEYAFNGVTVGSLSTTDSDAIEVFTYELLDDAGGRFALGGAKSDQIVVADASLFDYETLKSHDITVKVTDLGGNSLTQQITVGLTDVSNVTLIGTSAADVLIGSDGTEDLIQGLAGNDTLDGRGANDILDGGLGTDTATFAASTASVSVDLGTGTATGSQSGIDSLFSIENVIGGSGNDTIKGDSRNNLLDGGDGDDTIEGGAGNDTLIGGANTAVGDILSYSAATGSIMVSLAITTAQSTGGAGRDRVSGFENLKGGSADDTLTGSDGVNVIWGEAGDDTIWGGGGPDELHGGVGNDILIGGTGADALDGGSGDDTYVVDDAGDTVLESTAGAEGGIDNVESSVSFVLDANVENLTLTGKGGIDGTGNAGANAILGNRGANVLDGGTDADPSIVDMLKGGSGNDTYIVRDALDAVFDSSGRSDTVLSFVSYVLDSRLENLELQDAGGAIDGTGNRSANSLVGNSSANTLSGDSGHDVISGGGGMDVLIGGLGRDLLTGGADADVFVFNAPLSSRSNRDTIADFGNGADMLRLDSAIFTQLSAGALDAGNFVSGAGAAALDGDDFIVYDTATGVVSYDRNGNLSGGSVQFAVLTGTPGLTEGDFVIV